MPYAYQRGDYYRGDYYRGDGILSGIGKVLKGGVGAVVGGALGFLKGGPVGAVTGAVKGGTTALLGSGKSSLPEPPPAMTNFGMPTVQPPIELSMGGVSNLPIATQIPSTGGTRQWDLGSFLPGGKPLTYMQGGMCPSGYRLNKSGHWRKNGTYVPPRSICVKCRHMNVTNPRALRKGIRRAQGFAKLARRVMSFVQARAPKGKAVFRRKRR